MSFFTQNTTQSFRRKVFSFNEFNGDVTLECWSAGQGRYFDGTPNTELYDVCFDVHKNHVETTMDITIRGKKLIRWLREVIPCILPSTQEDQSEFTISYLHLLPHYPTLRSHLTEKENLGTLDARDEEEIMELRLFVRDYLLERSILESFGFENLYEREVLTGLHWHHIQHCSVYEELDYLDECVDLAYISETQLSNDKPQAPLQLDPSIRPELRGAIRQRHYQAVASVLAQNTGCIDAMTLTTAIKFYDSSIFSVLISHGAMVNGDEFHPLAEPLYIAAKRGHIAAVEALLQHGANIEGGNTCISASPLTGAASGGHASIVQYLVENGANVNGNKYKSPLSRAIKHGYGGIARYLLNHDANISSNDLREYCSNAGVITHFDIVNNFLNDSTGGNKEPCFSSTLLTATENGYINVVEYLVSHGADVNGRGYGDSPLFRAAQHGHINIVEYLVSHGAGVNGTEYGNLPLSKAAENGHINVVECLVSHGADVNGDKYANQPFSQYGGYLDGWRYDDPPLFKAAENGHINVVECLVSHGAKVDGWSLYSSPLSKAAENGHIDVVEYLVNHGAEVNGATYSDPPLSKAVENGHIDVVKYLVSHSAEINRRRNYLLGFDEYRALSHCRSPLCIAAENGHVDVVKYILGRGGRIDTADCCRIPPSNTERNGHIDAFKYIVGHGADASAWVPRYCPMVAAIQSRERHRIGRQLLSKLSKSHQRLMDGSGHPSASFHLRLFGENLGTYESVWKRGTRVIRNLMNGNLPDKLPDVISCLQVANTMRSVVPNPARVCSKEEFLNDLHRWRILINFEEQPLFTEITSCLWGRSSELRGDGSNQFSLEKTLSYFQGLVSNLVHQSGIFNIDQMEQSVSGHRLQSLQQYYSLTAAHPSQECSNIAPTVEPPIPAKREIWKEGIDNDASKSQDPEQHFDVLNRVTVLMAGAIFGAILLYLCLLRYGSSLRLPLIGFGNSEDSDPNRILVRNCTILVAYLGLSTSYLASEGWKATSDEPFQSSPNRVRSSYAPQSLSLDSGESPSDATHDTFPSRSERLTISTGISTYTPELVSRTIATPSPTNLCCPECGKSFPTVTNRNRHIRFDCKHGLKIRYPCRNRGCTKRPFTREAYRIYHERKLCKQKGHMMRVS